MKAISLYQPWASAKAIGSKRIETRSWATSYRGEMAIHAGKRKVVTELIHLSCFSFWNAALRPIVNQAREQNIPLYDFLPFGKVLSVGRLVDCIPMSEVTLGMIRELRYTDADSRRMERHHDSWTEENLGAFQLGRWAWIFEDMEPLEEPFSYTGRQRIFEVPDKLFKK